MINFTSRAVIKLEHSYWSIDDFTGLNIPSPPRWQGGAKTSHSMFGIVLQPVIAGINLQKGAHRTDAAKIAMNVAQGPEEGDA